MQLKCWGKNDLGELGIGSETDHGGESSHMGDALPQVELGTDRTVLAVSLGEGFGCAILDNQRIKCWGNNHVGQLGIGGTGNRGDQPNEMGNNLPYVDLGSGRTAVAVTAGMHHACAVLDDHVSVKCWGTAASLGIGTTEDKGLTTGTMGDSLPVVDLGFSPLSGEIC